MRIQEAIGELLEGRDLAGPDMEQVMRQVMTGQATPVRPLRVEEGGSSSTVREAPCAIVSGA